jgi:medium-chain acyl-[acyl-carrier-protein] hydrolase
MTNPWIYCSEPRPDASLRLFCLPYAGGGAPIFRSWPAELSQEIETCAIQLPGRGSRFMEKPYRRMNSLVPVLAKALEGLLDKPFAIFGHSMGAWVGFELVRLLRKQHGLEPIHFFASGASAPHLGQLEVPLHTLPERQLMQALRRVAGTPGDILENEEFMRLILPTLRADFEVCETYSYARRALLSCPITALGGLKDPRLKKSSLRAWRDETRGPFELVMISGDHFFVDTSTQDVLKHLAKDLHQGVERLVSTGPRPSELQY